MRKTNKQNGITLVALVITIIILLILAGIAISSLTGSGLFERAQQAKQETENAQANEDATLEEYAQVIENYIGKPITDTDETKPSQAKPAGAEVIENDLSKGIVIKDSSGNEWTWVVVPKSIYGESVTDATDYEGIYNALNIYASTYREGKLGQKRYWKDEWYYYVDSSTTLYGYVEKTIANETEYEEAVSSGNLYINKAGIEATSGRYNESNNYYERNTSLEEAQKINTTNNSGLSLNDYTTYYKKMLSSIYTNGGFWISRYEIGDSTATNNNYTLRKSGSGITGKAVSKANQIPYNYVKCSQAQGLVSGMSTDSNKTSSLLFGIQWDLICKYLEVNAFNGTSSSLNSNSVSWGNYSNSSIILSRGKYNTSPNSSTSEWLDITPGVKNGKILLTTGASEKTNKMNIYDFAGNEYEWTLEHATYDTSYPCARRGGDYNLSGSDGPASYRYYGSTTSSGENIGFRSALY